MEQRLTRKRLEQLWSGRLTGAAVRLVLCFGLAYGRPLGAALPFSVALAAAAPMRMLLPAAAGSIAGYLILGGMSGIRYAAAVSVLAGVRLIFRDSRDVAAVWWFEPTLAATVTLSTGLALVFGGDGGQWFWLETLVAGLAAQCFVTAQRAITELAEGGAPDKRSCIGLVGAVCAIVFTFAGPAAAIGAAAAGLILLPARTLRTAAPAEQSHEHPPAPVRTRRVAEVLRDLTEQLRTRGDGPLSTEVFSPAVEHLCKNCKQNYRCWGASYNTMMDCLTEMTMLLRRGADLAECDLPQPFASACVKRAEFVAEASAEARRFEETNRFRQDGLGDIGVLREQYRCFSAVLDDLGEMAGEEDVVPDPRLQERLISCLPPGSTLRAEYARQGKLRLSGYCPGLRPDLRRLSQMAAAVSGRPLSPPDLTRADGGWEFSIGEAACFTVSTRRHVSPCPGERVAGDTVRDFRTEDRKYVTVLSDGMGAGGAASRKSRMAAGCLEKLMQAGLGRESALRVLNSALLIGAEPEVYATLDVAVLDMYTGELEFIKAGAAPSFIVRGDKVSKVDSRALPAGLLPVLEPEVYRCRVQVGDRIVMLSDGVLPSGEQSDELEALIKNPDVTPKALVSLTKKVRENSPPDDMTVVMMTIEKM
ncbi:MAG TPA: SpoIIE family protein phosphatase [Terriglobales bacterium]|nr:SpoIIE family protein phosphatase [Terriglobales bacterium]